jgi:hypothetical protein
MCIFENCNTKNKYGDYCYKHRNNYLCDNNCIIIERFTNKESDYLKKDITNTILKIESTGSLFSTKFSKKQLFEILVKLIEDSFKKYNDNDLKFIINIQNKVKNKINQRLIKLRGPGYLDKSLCNNDTDFYSYDSIKEIDERYFYSYKDLNDFIWFFDIRSLNKLIELKQPNPYTMNKIPNSVIEEVNLLTKKLNMKENDELINKKEIKRTKKQIIKQKTIDLFSDIDTLGNYCQPEWFLNLNIGLLKRLYKNLEDIWNYRLQITNEVKSRICPPNGLAFTTRVSDVMRQTSKETLQELILNEIMKFSNAITDEDKKLGYMYFIIGMGSVSRECLETHPWLMHI